MREWRRNRAATVLEPKEAAKRRQNLQLETAVRKKPKIHIGRLDNVTWDEKALTAEVNTKKSEEVVNWSALARKYNVRDKNGDIAKNGGQIVKEALRIKGVNVDRFKRKMPTQDVLQIPRFRRKKRRMVGGETTFPSDLTREEVKKVAMDKIASGEYSIGERIVPRKVSFIFTGLIVFNINFCKLNNTI